MRHYLALVRKDVDSDFGVEFPDFPGCISAGQTVEEALANAEEALQFHVEGMIAEGEGIPDPTSAERMFGSPDLAGAIGYLVPLRPTKGRALRVNVTLDEHLLEEIDATAVKLGTTRSGFLAEAARKQLSTASVGSQYREDLDGLARAWAELSSEGDEKNAEGDNDLLFLPELSMRASMIAPREHGNVTDVKHLSEKEMARVFKVALRGDELVLVWDEIAGDRTRRKVTPINLTLTPEGKLALSEMRKQRGSHKAKAHRHKKASL